MNTPIKLPYGVSNFEDMVTQGYHYVDKTDYIERLEALPDKIFFFLRPRRFGKTLFVSMLQHYYGLEYKDRFHDFFDKYYIGQNPTPLANKYLVIKFEFTQINTDSKEVTLQGFLGKIRDGIEKFCTAYRSFFTIKEEQAINKKDYPAQLMSSLINLILKKAPNDYQRFDEKYIKLIMITTMMLTETFHVDSERETPAGYLDLSFIERPNVPVDHQYLFELKYLKKEDAKQLKSKQKEAKKQLLEYIEDSSKFRDLKNLQAWTVVVIKDELRVEKVK